MTKVELRQIAKTALMYEYGFAPALDKITLLECNWDGTYILFEIGNGLKHEYRFTSYKLADGSVWCGPDCIEKVERRAEVC